MSRQAISEPGAHGARLLLAAILAAGCKSIDATTWNLEQLHTPESKHKHTAALMENNLWFSIRSGLSALTRDDPHKFLEETNTKAVENPAKKCLEFLVQLASYNPKKKGNAEMQVEWFVRLATADEWKLSRERAVLELGKVGERLEIGLPRSLGADLKPTTPEELRAAVAALVAAVRPFVERERRTTDEDVEAFEAACEDVVGRPLDLDGARRALRVLGQLETLNVIRGDARESLVRASEHVQREAVKQALDAALRDPDELVRAAAVDACVRAVGRAPLDVFVMQIFREPSSLVKCRILNLVQEHGIPHREELADESSYERVRHEWLRRLYEISLDHLDPTVQVAAMQALNAVSDANLDSLREEDWAQWWREVYEPARRAELEAENAAPPATEDTPALGAREGE